MTEHILDLTLAGGLYDRTFPLIDGRVRPNGLRLRYLPMKIEEVFWRAIRHSEFDAAELSFSYYAALRSMGNDSFVAIPVFPSRFFRHGCVFVPSSSDRRSLKDLDGATVGVPEYAMTACVWIRGLLSDECGVMPARIKWRYGGIENPGRRDRADLKLPSDVDITPIDEAETLNELLAAGHVDAIISPRIPSAYWEGRVRRLVDDYVSVELDYFVRTRIFPIMHVVAFRKEILDRYPWSARSLFDGYQEAKKLTYEWLADINALPVSLAWYVSEYERTRGVMGEDPWADGLRANQLVLDTLLRYLREQGLVSEDLTISGLFAANTLDEFVI